MAGTFLDTTVVVHASEPSHVDGPKAAAFIRSHQPALVPHFALRELLTGNVRYLCEVHNILAASTDPGEALLALQRRSKAEGRKREFRVQVLHQLLSQAFTSNPAGQRGTVKAEILNELALRITRTWLRARAIPQVSTVQPLACFKSGDLIEGSANDLRGPNGTFNCSKQRRCAAAGYIYDDRVALDKVVKALHPSKLSAAARAKAENSGRRAALRELLRAGPVSFNKARCRAIGDAYFALMAPPGHVIATSNLADFDPLCKALNKRAECP